MARTKTKREKRPKTFNYYAELYGLLMILISVIGLGSFGPVGRMIKALAILMAGSLSVIPLVLLMVLGIALMIKRQMPSIINEKLMGMYLFILALLILVHFKYFSSDMVFATVMKNTINDLMTVIEANTPIWKANAVHGGGVVGAFFGFWLVKATALTGAKIVASIVLIIGLLLMFNASIVELVKNMIAKVKEYLNSEKRIKQKVEKAERAFDKNKQIVISGDEEVERPAANTAVPVRTDFSGYHLPPLSLLKEFSTNETIVSPLEIKEKSAQLEQVLKDFDIVGNVVAAHIGPTVTQYEIELKSGTKVNKVLNIQKEMALALAAKDVRIQAPIPGKNTIGIELPNKKTAMVGLKEILEMTPGDFIDSKLLVGLGKNIMGHPMYAEINNAPHLLVAGATGSGKSICINGIIASILMRSTPQEVKLVLIDPKKVELSVFNGIPHLLAPVVNDPKKASLVLRKIVTEMEDRYDLFSESGTKNIAGYNSYLSNKNKSLADEEKINPLPYIVVIIDELADLMLIAAKEVEDSILRITQMARAAGIHLIVATQRPSTDVITGLIKANIPSRISFAVSSSIDSRTILDMTGAEKLLGKGDMLFLPMGESVAMRIQGAFISEKEIKNIVDFVVAEQKASYDMTFSNLEEHSGGSSHGRADDYDDPIYDEVVEFVIQTGKVSASLLQRRFRLGYNRAARMVDLLEERGIISGPNGSKPREVLIKSEGSGTDETD